MPELEEPGITMCSQSRSSAYQVERLEVKGNLSFHSNKSMRRWKTPSCSRTLCLLHDVFRLISSVSEVEEEECQHSNGIALNQSEHAHTDRQAQRQVEGLQTHRKQKFAATDTVNHRYLHDLEAPIIMSPARAEAGTPHSRPLRIGAAARSMPLPTRTINDKVGTI